MGRIRISGTPGALHVTHADGRPYGAAPVPSTPTVDVRAALITMGFKPAEATQAVATAITQAGGAPSVETLLRAALRACARPRA